jgi:hypothetical protein
LAPFALVGARGFEVPHGDLPTIEDLAIEARLLAGRRQLEDDGPLAQSGVGVT